MNRVDRAAKLRQWAARRTSPGYPFPHLTGDGVWEVRTGRGPGSPGSKLGRHPASEQQVLALSGRGRVSRSGEPVG